MPEAQFPSFRIADNYGINDGRSSMYTSKWQAAFGTAQGCFLKIR